jgi:threonine dehydrogenase-like Zn-dependent dehydrogenase
MKAALFCGGKDIRVEEVPAPWPGPGEVLVRVRSGGVCGSDLHNYRGNRQSRFTPPWEQGHELAGEVAALGAGVSGLVVGQRVGIEGEHLIGCGACRHCREGQRHLCATRGQVDGKPHGSHGFSELDICKAANVHPLPDAVSFDDAVLADCYACAVHTLNRSPIGAGETLAIVGTGAIALTLGQVAKAWGARQVVMVGTRRPPLDVALACGAADEVFVSRETDAVRAVQGLTGGEGADLVVETVGGEGQVLAEAMSLARRGGAVSVMGIFTKPQTVNSDLAMQRELTVRWSNSLSYWKGVSEYRTALDLLADGRVKPGPIITHRFPLSRIAEAFAAADDKRGSGAIRVVVNA